MAVLLLAPGNASDGPNLTSILVFRVEPKLHIEHAGHGEDTVPTNDRDLIERHVARVVVRSQAIEIYLRDGTDDQDQQQSQSDTPSPSTSRGSPTVITVPWTAAATEAAKGILHSPSPKPQTKQETRHVLLVAIAKARGWIDDLMEGQNGDPRLAPEMCGLRPECAPEAAAKTAFCSAKARNFRRF